ncbi:unnamed protein product, partial [Vitrella brassicaformis CCMP3155]
MHPSVWLLGCALTVLLGCDASISRLIGGRQARSGGLQPDATTTTGFSSLLEVHQNTTNEISGVLDLNSHKYRASCVCGDGLTGFEKLAPTCNPSKVNLRQDRTGSAKTGLTIADVSKQYGQPLDATFTHVESHHFSSLDDRVTEPSIFTPSEAPDTLTHPLSSMDAMHAHIDEAGGDLGEFVLAANNHLLKQTDKSSLSQAEVDEYLRDYIAHVADREPTRLFYHSTDDAAVEHIKRVLVSESVDITEPSDNIREELTGVLADPLNMGDVHFRLMTQHPKWFHLEKDPELPGKAVVAFFKLLWDKTNPLRDKLKLDILAGHTNPKAFIEVSVSEACQTAGVAPMLTPRSSVTTALISHLSAVAERRREMADYFASRRTHSGAVGKEELLSAIQ